MKFARFGRATALAMIASLGVHVQPGYAQEPVAEEGSTEIVIVGDNGSTYRLTADSLRDAAKAFRKHRPEYAPDGVMYFKLVDFSERSFDGLELYLEPRRRKSSQMSIDLPIDNQGRIVIPTELAVSADWELRSNQRNKSLQLAPLILSPESSIADRRLGNYRLQCRVSIAFARLAEPLRLLASMGDPCDNGKVAMYARSDRAITDATLGGFEGQLLREGTSKTYFVPWYDGTLSNDARLRLTYR